MIENYCWLEIVLCSVEFDVMNGKVFYVVCLKILCWNCFEVEWFGVVLFVFGDDVFFLFFCVVIDVVDEDVV